MNASRLITLAAALVSMCATSAHALGIRSPVPVAVRARLDVHVLAAQQSGEWTVTSRSPSDESRFMLDFAAGNAATGILYLKGASEWSDSDDALGRVRFRAEQGDYTRAFTWSDSARADVRLFGDERRFFTGEMGTAVVEDDAVAAFEHRLGGRLDAGMRAFRAVYWIAGLNDGDDTRTNQYASVRFAPSFLFAGLGYVHDNPGQGENHAIAKAELAAYFRRATALASFEQSGFGTGAAFPSGSWESFDAGNYEAAAPTNSATFVELRTRRTRVGADHLIDASYQYGAVGSDYSNDLSSLIPGSVTNTAWVDWAHRRYALDARLAGYHTERNLEDFTRRGVNLTTRARLVNNAELLLRGGALRDELEGAHDARGFVHAAYSRELREFMGGVHVLVDDIGEDASAAAGAEVRLNWSASGAITARWIVTDDTGGGDAIFLRAEYRPSRRTWVTLAYGYQNRGDDVYFIEDRDVMPAPDAGNALTLTVRGDL